MSGDFNPGDLLRRARALSGLSQRELARRAKTAQSVVARIEGGESRPRTGTLERLLGAAGFELRPELVPRSVPQSHMMEDVARVLRLTPEERLLEVRNLSRLEHAVKRV